MGLSFDGWGYERRGIHFSRMNGLRASVFIPFALGSIVPWESIVKTPFFMDIFGFLGGGEFREGDGIDIHGRASGGLRGQRLGGEGESSSFQGKDAHSLCMEGLCLFNPFGNSDRNNGHREDHGSELLI